MTNKHSANRYFKVHLILNPFFDLFVFRSAIVHITIFVPVPPYKEKRPGVQTSHTSQRNYQDVELQLLRQKRTMYNLQLNAHIPL